MLKLLEQYLLDRWVELPGVRNESGPISFLVQATGISKVCFLVFRGGCTPCLVVKTARSPAQEEGLRRETALVRRLRTEVPSDLLPTLPGPLHEAAIGEHNVVVEPYLRGRPLDALAAAGEPLDPARAAMHLELVCDWLIRLHRTTARRTRLTDEAVGVHLLGPLAEMAARCNLTDRESAFLEHVAEVARGLRGRCLPLCPLHGDLRPGNILLDGARPTVLDWEFGREAALPLHDWFTFVLQYLGRSLGLAELDGRLDGYKTALRQTFYARTWFGELVAEHTARYCRVLGLEPDLLPVLLALTLVNNATKLQSFLESRAQHGYLYLLRDAPTAGSPHAVQIRRQAFVWLLGELAETRDPPFAWL